MKNQPIRRRSSIVLALLMLLANACGDDKQPTNNDRECRADTDCASSGQICKSGQCENPQITLCLDGTENCACTDNTLCQFGLTCVQGECLPDCPEGTINHGSGCEPATGCDVCDIADRQCNPDHTTCGTCKAGFVVVGDSCKPAPNCEALNIPGTYAADCQATHKTCVEGTPTPTCGECLPGFIAYNGGCVEDLTCADLACEESHQTCSTVPFSHCSGCGANYVQEGYNCRPAKTCTNNPCDARTSICIEPRDVYSDRTCAAKGTLCPDDEVMNDAKTTCLACVPGCDTQQMRAAGSAGFPVSTAIAGTECACATMEGFFLSRGANGKNTQIMPCDQDGDGWVRDSVLGLVDLPQNNTGSKPLFENNRCTVRMIRRIEIYDEANNLVGSRDLSSPIAMTESTRNDDDSQIAADELDPEAAARMPRYSGTSGRLYARVLNGLTKGCVSREADFNDNGIADVEERQEDAGDSYTAILAAHSTTAQLLKDYTFFMELYDSYFVGDSPKASAPWRINGNALGGKMLNGVLQIREKSRHTAFMGLPLQYNVRPNEENNTVPDGSYGTDYWRSCTRAQDSNYSQARGTQNTAGLINQDFARFMTPVTDLASLQTAWPARPMFGHNSQFKCIVVENTPSRPLPNSFKTSEVDAKFVRNDCQIATTADRQLSCSVSLASPRDGWVGWGAVRFEPYADTNQYNGGCVDESQAFTRYCPGYDLRDASAEAVVSDGDANNYGKLRCGCARGFGGANCNVGCPPGMLLTASDYQGYPAVKRPYWMCASTTATANIGQQAVLTGTEVNTGDASSYTMTGYVPTSVGTGVASGIAQDDHTGNSYDLQSGMFLP